MIGPLELAIILLLLVPVVLLALGVRAMVTRPCPRCGKRVRNGLVVCNHCQHEFAA